MRATDINLEFDLGNGRKETGTLRVTKRSARNDFEPFSIGEVPVLRWDPSDNVRINFPVFTPSSGRPKKVRLDLKEPMMSTTSSAGDWGYVQFVCIKAPEYDDYVKLWPHLNFFLLPECAKDLGIGASRFWILQLARKICHPSFPMIFMMDDNVLAWKAVKMRDQDAVFDSFDNFPLERDAKTGQVGTRKRDLPLAEVLRFFQMDEFVDELHKFGIIGFDRYGRRPVDVVYPYARRHVYKAIIINLNVIGEATYREKVFVWEDLEFNLRVSGRERKAGGGSKDIPKAEALAQHFGGAWVSKDLLRPEDPPPGEDRNLVLSSNDPEGPAMILKCYRFEYSQDQAISRKGGCSGDVLRQAAGKSTAEDTEEGDSDEGNGEDGAEGDGDEGGDGGADGSIELAELKSQLSVKEAEQKEANAAFDAASAADKYGELVALNHQIVEVNKVVSDLKENIAKKKIAIAAAKEAKEAAARAAAEAAAKAQAEAAAAAAAAANAAAKAKAEAELQEAEAALKQVSHHLKKRKAEIKALDPEERTPHFKSLMELVDQKEKQESEVKRIQAALADLP